VGLDRKKSGVMSLNPYRDQNVYLHPSLSRQRNCDRPVLCTRNPAKCEVCLILNRNSPQYLIGKNYKNLIAELISLDLIAKSLFLHNKKPILGVNHLSISFLFCSMNVSLV
jgi:hypothetical protein